ncbi:FliH/SctL family protein [Piscinibacter terrae]|nr:FliH/SctL family protein [Albitalea terrae]
MRKIVKDATLAQPRVALRAALAQRPIPAARPLAAHAEPAARPVGIAVDEEKHLRQLRQNAERAGYEAGMKQAQADIDATLDAERARVNRILDELRANQARHVQTLTGQCEDFAFTVLCRMLGEGAVERAAVAAVAAAVLREAGDGAVTTLRVHPEDAALMQVVLEGSGHQGIAIESDPGIKLGGCVADTAAGRLDASFDTQLALLAQALAEARARRNGTAAE